MKRALKQGEACKNWLHSKAIERFLCRTSSITTFLVVQASAILPIFSCFANLSILRFSSSFFIGTLNTSPYVIKILHSSIFIRITTFPLRENYYIWSFSSSYRRECQLEAGCWVYTLHSMDRFCCWNFPPLVILSLIFL